MFFTFIEICFKYLVFSHICTYNHNSYYNMEFTAQQIADFLHGEVVGDPTVKLNNVSKIEDGKPNTLTFLANLKYAHYIYDTNASAVLVNKTFVPEHEIKATLIKVDDAYACIAMLLNMVSQARPKKSGIEENTHIDKSVEIQIGRAHV